MTKGPGDFTEAETFHNATLYVSEMMEESTEQAMEKFIEVVGSDDPEEWNRRGYRLFQNQRTVPKTDTQTISRVDLVLVKGNKVVSAFEIRVYFVENKDMKVSLNALSLDEAQTSLGVNKSN